MHQQALYFCLICTSTDKMRGLCIQTTLFFIVYQMDSAVQKSNKSFQGNEEFSQNEASVVMEDRYDSKRVVLYRRMSILSLCGIVIGLILIAYILISLRLELMNLKNELIQRENTIMTDYKQKNDEIQKQLSVKSNDLLHKTNEIAEIKLELKSIKIDLEQSKKTVKSLSQSSSGQEKLSPQQEAENLKRQMSLNQRRGAKKQQLGRDVPGQNLLRDRKNQPWIEPTLGRPTKDTVFNYTEVTFEHYYEFQKRLDVLLRPYNDTNCEITRYGRVNDGGYLLCQNFVNSSSALINIGIMGMDDFGCQFTTKNNFLNIQYDCTDRPGEGSCGTNKGRNRQNLVCLSDATEQFEHLKYSTIQDMIDSNNLTDKHIILKMDGEGSQWGALRNLPLRYLEYIDQLLIQTHYYKFYKMYWGYADVIKRLSEYFVAVTFNEINLECFKYMTPNQKHFVPSGGVESSMINRKLITLNSNDRSYKKHSLNTISFPFSPQRCEMIDQK